MCARKGYLMSAYLNSTVSLKSTIHTNSSGSTCVFICMFKCLLFISHMFAHCRQKCRLDRLNIRDISTGFVGHDKKNYIWPVDFQTKAFR